MGDEIWVSEAPLRSENVKLTLNSFVPDDRIFDKAFDFADDAGKQNGAGVPLSREHFPEHVYSDRTRRAAKQTFSDIFIANSYVVVSEAAAHVLRQFDLGLGSLYPTRLTKADMETPIGEGWYCINFGNAKETIFPDKPIGMLPVPGTGLFILGGYLKEGQLTVRQSASEGPDIWVDPRVKRGFFVSGRLAAAIKKAKLRGFYLSRCTLA